MVSASGGAGTAQEFLILEKQARHLVYGFVNDNTENGIPPQVSFDVLRAMVHSAAGCYTFAIHEHASGCPECYPKKKK